MKVMMCVSVMWVEMQVEFFFFFKQKTAYEMRISDWSSDVCSSDLIDAGNGDAVLTASGDIVFLSDVAVTADGAGTVILDAGGQVRAQGALTVNSEIGRASCRVRVCQYV